MSKIIKATWFTQEISPYFFGVVITQPEVGNKRAYIGTAHGINEEVDKKYIVEHGARLSIPVLEEILQALKGTT